MFEYLAQVQSAVRRINYRVGTLADKFGKDSKIVQDINTQIDVHFKNNYRFKDGTMQIIKPQQIYNDPDMLKAIENMDANVKTYQQIKEEYQPEYEEYKSQAEFFKEKVVPIEKFINVFINIDKVLEWMYPTDTNEKQDALEIMQTKGQRKTYSQLSQVVELMKK